MGKRHRKRTVGDAGNKRTVEDAGNERTVGDAGPYRDGAEFQSVTLRVHVRVANISP